MKKVIVLIATTPRLALLTENALPSILNQTAVPAAVVIVSDKRHLSQDEALLLRTKFSSIPLYLMKNSRKAGAAGSWNTGIDFIAERFPESYIAIIDDDDRWDPSHLNSCLSNSNSGTADVILSGIKIIINQEIVALNIPKEVSVHDFLIGNPGWQGSNTFMKTEFAKKVGGFTDGLISGNDRDFAIRALEYTEVQMNYTNKATVDWVCNKSPDALSAPGSKQKLRGSAQFLKLHGNKMTVQDMDSYFLRAQELFSLSKQDIIDEIRILGNSNE